MPKDAFGDIILFGGLAVGGYFLWNWWTGQTPAAAPATATPATPAAPSYQYTAPTATAQLTSAAASNAVVQAQKGLADAYQWATIYNGIAGLPSIASVNINSTFFRNGLPANQTALANTPNYSQQGLPLLTIAQFIQGITAAGVTGLSGFGQVPAAAAFEAAHPELTTQLRARAQLAANRRTDLVNSPAGQAAIAAHPELAAQLQAREQLIDTRRHNLFGGVSGFGQAPVLIPVPMMIGGSPGVMHLPAGTTPAELQRRLRVRR